MDLRVKSVGGTGGDFRRGHLGGAGGRRGITLMEVLISMFVLLIGVLSVAALIPVGRFEVGQGDQVDRAAAVARSAFHTLKIFGFLQPDSGLGFNPPGSTIGTADFYPVLSWYTGEVNGTLSWPWVKKNAGGNIDVVNGMPVCPPGYPPMAFAFDPWAKAYNAGSVINADNLNAGDIAAQPTQDDLGQFPILAVQRMEGNLPGKPSPALTNPMMPVMTRITYVNAYSPLTSNLQNHMLLSQAARIFQPRDDLTFSAPSPTATLTMSAGQATQSYFPPQSGLTPGTIPLMPQYREYDGNYSWMATFVPTGPTSTDGWAGAPAPMYNNGAPCRTPYIVSIVVYYQRPILVRKNVLTANEIDGNPAVYEYPERLVYVSAFPGNGIGGGEVTLSTLAGSWKMGPSTLDLNAGQWIMLCGQISLPPNTPLNPTGTQTNLNIFRWYRVVAAYDVQDGTYSVIPPNSGLGPNPIGWYTYHRNVTLAGPDWPVQEVANNYNPNSSLNSLGLPSSKVNFTYAVICHGVVGVYERVMNLELPSVWGTK